MKLSEKEKQQYNMQFSQLTRAGKYLADLIENNGQPVLRPADLFSLVWKMYVEPKSIKLYLRSDVPDADDFDRLKIGLIKNNIISADKDYGKRIIRVNTVPDLSAEDIVCLVDPICYISHLSAMQRWGLTDRSPKMLLLTRPDKMSARPILQEYFKKNRKDGLEMIFPPTIISHPHTVRKRPIRVYETTAIGDFIKNRHGNLRISTIGQTFLDMLQKPDLCGGMSHVLQVWKNNAETYIDEIIESVNKARSNLVKSRAGYIIEEYMGLSHNGVEPWKALGQRGSSRKLDPSKEFKPTFSETWMISLNVK